MPLLSLVQVAQAQTAVNASTFGSAINPIIKNVVDPVVELAFALALIVFIYGVLRMVLYAGSEEARTEGKRSILYGLIGMFIMIGAWGIIYLVANTVKTI